MPASIPALLLPSDAPTSGAQGSMIKDMPAAQQTAAQGPHPAAGVFLPFLLQGLNTVPAPKAGVSAVATPKNLATRQDLPPDGKTLPPEAALAALLASLFPQMPSSAPAAARGALPPPTVSDTPARPASLPQTAPPDIPSRQSHEPGVSGEIPRVSEAMHADQTLTALTTTAPAPGAEKLAQTMVAALKTPSPPVPAVHDALPPFNPAAVAAPPAVFASASHAVPPAVVVDTPFGRPGWEQELGSHVLWLASRDLHGAQLQLNPPQLGPIEVRIALRHDQASVSFSALHPAVRDALEAAIPRLKEMLSTSGLNLMNVDVSQHSFARQQERDAGAPPYRGGFTQGLDGSAQPGSGIEPVNAAPRVVLGLLDIYA